MPRTLARIGAVIDRGWTSEFMLMAEAIKYTMSEPCPRYRPLRVGHRRRHPRVGGDTEDDDPYYTGDGELYRM